MSNFAKLFTHKYWIMKNIIKLTFLLMGLLLLHPLTTYAQSESAKSAYQRGITAFNNKKYTQAFPDLMLAASANIPEAFSPLIELYVDGDYNGSGKGNYSEALKWVKKAMDAYFDGGASNTDLAVTCMMNYDPLCFLTGDYQETIDHVTSGYSKSGIPKLPYLMLQVAASYLKLGNTAQANKWINDAVTVARGKNDNLSIHTANALLSKIAFDNKNYAKALELSKDAASDGGEPLAAYVYGASLIKTDNSPEIGKQWVKLAAEYDYYGLIQINCFENEIRQYWNSIKNITL